jgi:hypothetical protein
MIATHIAISLFTITSTSLTIAKVVENVLRKKEESGWGPNAVFRFPQEGGTGGIWKKVAAKLPQEKQKYGVTVTEFKTAEKQLVLSNGDIVEYKQCIR